MYCILNIDHTEEGDLDRKLEGMLTPLFRLYRQILQLGDELKHELIVFTPFIGEDNC